MLNSETAKVTILFILSYVKKYGLLLVESPLAVVAVEVPLRK